jgi:hypothetical protein
MFKHRNQNGNLGNILFDVIIMNDANDASKMLTIIHLLYKYKYFIGHYPLFHIDIHICDILRGGSALAFRYVLSSY